jgi:hypothetical protein
MMKANELAEILKDPDVDETILYYLGDRTTSVAYQAGAMLLEQAEEIRQLKRDRDRLDWIWENRACFQIKGIELFTIPTQYTINIYGIRPMLDDAMQLANEERE